MRHLMGFHRSQSQAKVALYVVGEEYLLRANGTYSGAEGLGAQAAQSLQVDNVTVTYQV
jgi:hypothetical protein